jgi:hypothetical protein
MSASSNVLQFGLRLYFRSREARIQRCVLFQAVTPQCVQSQLVEVMQSADATPSILFRNGLLADCGTVPIAHSRGAIGSYYSSGYSSSIQYLNGFEADGAERCLTSASFALTFREKLYRAA